MSGVAMRLIVTTWPYLLATISTLIIASIRYLFSDTLEITGSIMPFAVSVIISAWLGGLESGLIATGIGTLVGICLFSPPYHTLPPGRSHDDILFVALFIVAGILISSALSALRSGRARLLDETKRLQETVLEQRHAQAEAKRQRDWFGTTLDSIGDAIIITGDNGKIVKTNAIAEALLGYRLDIIRGKLINDIFTINNSSGEKLKLDNYSSFRNLNLFSLPLEKTAHHNDVILLSRDGIHRPIELSVARLSDSDNDSIDELGGPAHAIIVFRDITERKRTEEKLKASEQRLADFFENVEIGLNLVDAQGKVLQANRAMRELVQCQRNHYVGQNMANFWVDENSLKSALNSLLDGHTVHNLEGCLRTSQGEIRQVVLNANGHWDGHQFEYARCVVRDITDRKRAEQEATRLMESLRRADRRKDEFLAVLAHELRNPLAPIVACVDILMQNPSSKIANRSIQTISRQTTQMVRLVDDLLQMSRITHHRLELRRTPISINQIINNAIEACQPLIDARCHQLMLKLSHKKMTVNGDSTRLAQIFSNLINNAAKFTPCNGCIIVKSECDEKEVFVSVKDNGVGIHPNTIDYIFDTFTRVELSSEVVPGGLGLGLSLVKQLTLLHGGKVVVHSSGINCGSEFKITLPLYSFKKSEHQSSIEFSQNSLNATKPALIKEKLKIMIVDDNVDAAESLATLLELAGHEIFTCHEGKTAIQIIQEINPKLVFLDIGLPQMNGYEIASHLQFWPYRNQATLVALTGYGQENDIILAKKAGFDFHIIKPATMEQINKIIASLNSNA